MNNELISFIVEAKKNAYASGVNAEFTATNLGSKDIPFQRGTYSYLDRYYGEIDFIGQEVVWKDRKAVWGMNYHGVTFDAIDGFPEFLLKALKQVTNEAPYRGPKQYTEAEFEYVCEWSGDVENFEGREIIKHNGKDIFCLKFHGGKINYE